jgi:hypothetical protein
MIRYQSDNLPLPLIIHPEPHHGPAIRPGVGVVEICVGELLPFLEPLLGAEVVLGAYPLGAGEVGLCRCSDPGVLNQRVKCYVSLSWMVM